ncbi:MAG: hypothetical protein IT450_03035 [Phycisphaerales bacterium]|nr:hypothetical protein [Phycisphaerales bacterium]
MWSFGAMCDEFCISTRLFLKLDLHPSREASLHFFEQIRRSFPTMTRMRRREDGGLLLDEEEDQGEGRRFLRTDPTSIRFGVHDPRNAAAIELLARRVFDLAPAALSLSDLDYDYMDVLFAFDLEYRGNHDELIAETFFANHPFQRALLDDASTVIECQPFMGASLGEGCDRQLYLEVRGRTSAYEVRTGEFDAAPLSVNLTARRYWSGAGATPQDVHSELLTHATQSVQQRIVPQIVQPLAAAIASRR